ncbi:MAG: hypothetical protein M0R68_05260 [Bacteroidetes bacterium]|nr:hypothetical protein [Bacteroidota bacterium]
MKQLLHRALMVLTLLSSIFYNAFSTDRTVPITFSVTTTGINRFIAGQYNNPGFTKSWSGSYQGSQYTIQLKKPIIMILDNTIKIQMKLSIISVAYTGPVTISPTLTISSTTISAANIIAAYTDLHAQINSVSNALRLDAGFRDIIEQKLSPINWIIYQGKVLNESTSRFSESSDIGWKGIPTLTASVTNNEINFTVTPTIASNAPWYKFYFNRPTQKKFGLKIRSNNQVTIENMKVYEGGSEYPVNFSSETSYVDPENGDIVHEYFVEKPENATQYVTGLSYNIRLKRQNIEVTWNLLCLSSGFGFGSTSFYTVQTINPLKGE